MSFGGATVVVAGASVGVDNSSVVTVALVGATVPLVVATDVAAVVLCLSESSDNVTPVS